ncbi:MAG: HAD-IA family hydrolase [Bacteroidota bacterium]
MKPKAIIFDVDGTIANSERWGHLPASNEAIKMLGLPFEWDWPTFKRMLTIPGTANRLRHELEARSYSKGDIEAYIGAFVPIKKELYINKYLPQVSLRTGIKEFMQRAIVKGVKMAIVSTTYEAQINELLATKLPDEKPFFNPVLGKESGVKTGSEGVLYERCLSELNLQPEECIVIEDSSAGLAAARKAGIPTLVFYNDYTENEDFKGAVLVESSITNVDPDKILAGEKPN